MFYRYKKMFSIIAVVSIFDIINHNLHSESNAFKSWKYQKHLDKMFL